MATSKSKATKVAPKAIERHETKFLPEGDYCFRDQVQVEGRLEANVLTARGWLLERFHLKAGTVSFASGSSIVRPESATFWAFYPCFTLSRVCLHDTRATVTGKASVQPGPAGHVTPFIFKSNASLEQDAVTTILATASNRQSIDANPHASSLSIKARHLIAATYTDETSIAGVALRLGVTNAHLARQFRRDYALSPREYLHQLRIADATLQLARGHSIADVSGNSGYGDLSRFYKQFRKTTRVAPGACRDIVAPERT